MVYDLGKRSVARSLEGRKKVWGSVQLGEFFFPRLVFSKVFQEGLCCTKPHNGQTKRQIITYFWM